MVAKRKKYKEAELRYVLLNPEVYFEEVVSEAKSVVLAGGTMQPLDGFLVQLFGGKSSYLERLHYFTCDHVIPDENLICITLGSSPRGKDFKFTYDNRSDKNMLNDLGRVLFGCCDVVPKGVIIFFTSYAYEKFVIDHWKQTGMYDRLNGKKKVYN